MDPETWTLTVSTHREAMERVEAVFRLDVARGAAASRWSIQLPTYYDDCCRRHYLALRLRSPSTRWKDVAPLYAVAAAIHRPGIASLPETDARILETHFPALRGDSGLTWQQARPVLVEMWEQLTKLRGDDAKDHDQRR